MLYSHLYRSHQTTLQHSSTPPSSAVHRDDGSTSVSTSEGNLKPIHHVPYKPLDQCTTCTCTVTNTIEVYMQMDLPEVGGGGGAVAFKIMIFHVFMQCDINKKLALHYVNCISVSKVRKVMHVCVLPHSQNQPIDSNVYKSQNC